MDVDPKLAYWTWAWLNMSIAVGSGAAGIQKIRRGAVAQHKRRMLIFACLVLLFLVSYVPKVLLLGGENLEVWRPSGVYVLRFHELCVFTMLASGTIALRLAYRLGLARGVPPVEVDSRALRLHRGAGRIAVLSGAVGLLSAAYVLIGMYGRLGA
jgi:uncharacterized membrane protein YozB (DUF420 family)